MSRRLVFHLVAAPLGLSLWSRPPADLDLGWQLLGGQWIAEHHSIPNEDFINAFNGTWHDYHWLAQIILYRVYAWGGFDALRMLFGILMALLAVVMSDIALICGRGKAHAGAIISFAVAWSLIYYIAAVRPQMMAVVILAYSVRMLLRAPARGELLHLLALAVLCVNMHVYWIFIPFLWFCYRCIRYPTISYAKRWGGLAALTACGLVTPYAWMPLGAQPPFAFINYALLWDYTTTSNRLRELVTEFWSSLSIPGYFRWATIFYLCIFSHFLNRKRARAMRHLWLSAGAALLLAISAVKFAAVLAVCALPLLSNACSRIMLGLGLNRRTLASAALVVGALFSIREGSSCIPWLCSNDAVLRSVLPIEACTKIAELDLRPSNGRRYVMVLTHFNHGGWCSWAMYQRSRAPLRVTTDGRTQWVPPVHYDAGFDLFDIRGPWHEVLDAWNPDAALIPTGTPLMQAFLSVPNRWSLIYQDGIAGVFLPVKFAK